MANGGVRSRNHGPVVLAALVVKMPGRKGCGGEVREQSERSCLWCLFERKRHVNLMYCASRLGCCTQHSSEVQNRRDLGGVDPSKYR